MGFQIINVLMLLWQILGPTPVVGFNGTTAAFQPGSHQVLTQRIYDRRR